jgi:hypothetical protein
MVFGLLVGNLSTPSVLVLVNKLKSREVQDATVHYRQDSLFGVSWQWSYHESQVIHLLPLCPDCYGELVCEVFTPDRFGRRDRGKTRMSYFKCQKCGETKASLEGSRSQAEGDVAREIQRKVRTGEWRSGEGSE